MQPAFPGLAALGFVFLGALAFASDTRPVDVNPFGQPMGPGVESDASISGDGRFVAFTSSGASFGPHGPSGVVRVYLRDMNTNATIELVSKASNGSVPATGASRYPSISHDGRFTVFESTAPIVPEWGSGAAAVFLYDRLLGATERVSMNSAGGSAWAVLPGGGGNRISNDGRFVVYDSAAALVPEDAGNALDVYVRDRFADRTILVTVAAVPGSGSDGPSTSGGISADGRFVVFRTQATNLTGTAGPGIYVKDLVTGVVERVDVDASGNPLAGGTSVSGLSISPDGDFVTFDTLIANPSIGDSDSSRDVYLKQRSTGHVEVVSRTMSGRNSEGESADADVSWGGRYVVFRTSSGDIVPWDQNDFASDIVLFDRWTSRATLMNVSSKLVQGSAGSAYLPSISDSGRHVAFVSTQSGLHPQDTVAHSTDVFRRDRLGFASLEVGKSGIAGIPFWAGTGSVEGGGSGTLKLGQAAQNAASLLFVGLDRSYAEFPTGPFTGSIVAVVNPLIVVPFVTTASGGLDFPYVIPASVALPPEIYFQSVTADPTAIHGASVSNGLAMGL